MAGPYYVKTDGNDANTGLSWAQAFATWDKLIGTGAVLAAGEVAYVRAGTYTQPDGNVAWVVPNGAIIQVSNAADTAEPPTTFTEQANVVVYVDDNLALNGAGSIRGVKFTGGSGSSSSTLQFAATTFDILELKNCDFILNNTSTGSDIFLGECSSSLSTRVRTVGCRFVFGGTSQSVKAQGFWDSIDDTFAGTGTVPTILIDCPSNCIADIQNGNLSTVNTTLFNLITAACSGTLTLRNCKMAASYTVLGTTSKNIECYMYRTSGADTHHLFGYYNSLGSMVVSDTVYLTTLGMTYDGTNRYSMLITTTADASKANPFRTPWFRTRQAAATLTPYVEVLRKGSTTKYKDGEAYSSWSAQTTSGFPLGSMVDDRANNLALDGDDQAASSLGADDWTGEDASNNAYMKFGPASSITVAEIGHIENRIIVTKASVTDLYVDMKVRS